MAGESTFGADFFAKSYTYFDSQLDSFLNQHYQSVVDAVKGPLTGLLVIYIALYAIAIMRGVVQEPLQDFIWKMAKLCLIFTAATTVAYKSWITDPVFHGAPTILTQAISGKDYKDAGAEFDKLGAYAATTYNALRTDANAQPITNIGAALEDIGAAFLLEAVSAIACVVGFALTMFSLVGLAITIALGPIFIALSVFEWGKGMFQGWLRQAFKYVVELAVLVAMAELIISLGTTVIPTKVASDPVNEAMFLVVYYALGAFFLFQAPSIAGGITGGSGLSAGELVATAGAAAAFGAKKAGLGIEKAANVAGRGPAAGARWAANKARNRVNSIRG